MDVWHARRNSLTRTRCGRPSGSAHWSTSACAMWSSRPARARRRSLSHWRKTLISGPPSHWTSVRQASSHWASPRPPMNLSRFSALRVPPAPTTCRRSSRPASRPPRCSCSPPTAHPNSATATRARRSPRTASLADTQSGRPKRRCHRLTLACFAIGASCWWTAGSTPKAP